MARGLSTVRFQIVDGCREEADDYTLFVNCTVRLVPELPKEPTMTVDSTNKIKNTTLLRILY